VSGEISIGEFEKNSAETIRVQLVRTCVGLYVDIRVWSTARPGDGPGLHRTERGFMIAVELVPELRGLLEQAYQTAEVGR
jgi:signal transduction protein with GAF and PtsI domain